MAQASRTIKIYRPIKTVFAFFADSANDTRWRDHVKEIHREGPVGLGVAIRQKVAGPLGLPIPADMTITHFEPDTALTFQVTQGPIQPTISFTFESAFDGDPATVVTLTISAELSGIKKVLMGAPVQRSMNGEIANLDNAKAFLEV